MQSRPDNWAAVFAVPHVTEYRFLIGGSEYRESDIQGTPIIEKPLMQEPCIGRCCTGSLTIAVRPHANETIPKAACVQAFCRLKSRNGNTVTDWVKQGKYWVSRRSTSGSLVTLTCRDGMMLAGRTYLDKTQYTVWPVAMADVFNEIVSLMGVTGCAYVGNSFHDCRGARRQLRYDREGRTQACTVPRHRFTYTGTRHSVHAVHPSFNRQEKHIAYYADRFSGQPVYLRQ